MPVTFSSLHNDLHDLSFLVIWVVLHILLCLLPYEPSSIIYIEDPLSAHLPKS